MKHATYWCPDKSAADAVEHAKSLAREDGYNAATVAKVVFVERPLGWAVTLVLR